MKHSIASMPTLKKKKKTEPDESGSFLAGLLRKYGKERAPNTLHKLLAVVAVLVAILLYSGYVLLNMRAKKALAVASLAQK